MKVGKFYKIVFTGGQGFIRLKEIIGQSQDLGCEFIMFDRSNNSIVFNEKRLILKDDIISSEEIDNLTYEFQLLESFNFLKEKYLDA